METTKLFQLFSLLILIFATKESISQVMTSYQTSSIVPDVYSNLTQILTSCPNNHTGLLIFADTLFNINQQWLSGLYSHFSGVIQSYNTMNVKLHQSQLMVKKTEAMIFIIQSTTFTIDFLEEFCSSPLFYHFATLYIVNESANGCDMVRTVLQRLIIHHSLTVYFICSNEGKNVKIFTHNILTRSKPLKWTVTENKHKNKINLAIYSKDCQEVDICDNLYFDRTQFLDNYKLVIIANWNFEKKDRYNFSNGYQRYWKFFNTNDHLLIKRLVTSLNTSASTYRYEVFNENFELLSEIKRCNSSPNHLLLNIEFDLILLSLTLTHEIPPCWEATYPVPLSENRLITYHKGFQTPLEKICDFYGIWTLLFTVFILTLVFIVIWHGERKKIAFAIFETVRLLINHSLRTQMSRLPIRVFFGVIFIYFLVIQATFHGHLAKFLTKPELRRHVETMEDLKNVDKNIVFDINDVETRIIKESVFELSKIAETCVDYIITKDHSAICINDYILFYNMMKKNPNLYMNKKSISTAYVKYLLPRGKIVNERINKFFIWQTDLGFSDFHLRKWKARISTYNKKIAAKLNNGFEPVSIDNLTFNFIFFIVGLTIAAISFFIEIYFAQKVVKLKRGKCCPKIGASSPEQHNIIPRSLRRCTNKQISTSDCYLLDDLQVIEPIVV